MIVDLFRPNRFLIVGPTHVFDKVRSSYTVSVTTSTTAKFGGTAGGTTTRTDVVLTQAASHGQA